MVSSSIGCVELLYIYKISHKFPAIKVTNDEKFNLYAREHFIIDDNDDDDTTIEDDDDEWSTLQSQ